MIKVSDYTASFFANINTEHVFLLPGGGCMHLVDSFGKNKNIKEICFLHEQSVVIAADAYSQYRNKPAVALVTTGPGGTNAITGVAGAWIDSVPVIILSGQVKRQDMIGKSGLRQRGIQEVDIIPVIKSVTKYAETIIEPEKIRYHLEKALFIAKEGRPGPVWLDIPLDVQGALVNEDDLPGFEPKAATHKTNKNEIAELVEKTIKLINESERPVIMAGNGIRLSGAVENFKSLINNLEIPVLTTWKSIDFLPENHKFYFGRPGSIGQRGANFIQQNSDFILTIGARLDFAQIGYYYENFAREAKKVIVDIDKEEIDKMNMQIDVKACADAKVFIEELEKRKDKIIDKNRIQWLQRCINWKKKYPVILPEYWEEKEYVNTYVLIDILSDLLTENDVIVPGSSGSCSEVLLQAFRVKEGQRIQNNPGLGSMGYGLPASIGACLASNKKRTISIIGDGGMQHNIQELETIKRLNLPIKMFVLNNNGYASIRNTQKNHFNENYVCCDPSSGLSLPDICKISSAYGISSAKLSNHDGIENKIRSIIEKEGPVICEVMVNPYQVTAPRLSSEVKPDGSIVSKPLEDLWPFLSRDEFAENMIIKKL